jgi:hypothetical protein
MDIFSCFGMWNSFPKFVRTFQLHPVYKRQKIFILSFCPYVETFRSSYG